MVSFGLAFRFAGRDATRTVPRGGRLHRPWAAFVAGGAPVSLSLECRLRPALLSGPRDVFHDAEIYAVRLRNSRPDADVPRLPALSRRLSWRCTRKCPRCILECRDNPSGVAGFPCGWSGQSPSRPIAGLSRRPRPSRGSAGPQKTSCSLAHGGSPAR